jgi:hypothetical protein
MGASCTRNETENPCQSMRRRSIAAFATRTMPELLPQILIVALAAAIRGCSAAAVAHHSSLMPSATMIRCSENDTLFHIDYQEAKNEILDMMGRLPAMRGSSREEEEAPKMGGRGRTKGGSVYICDRKGCGKAASYGNAKGDAAWRWGQSKVKR